MTETQALWLTLLGIALGVVSIEVTIATFVWVEHRHRLREDIKLILKQCRETPDWDDRSEYKLSQWLLGVGEDEMHRCGLRQLRRIRASLSDYLYIHLYGRDPVAQPGALESALRGWAERLRYRRENRVQSKRK